MAADAGRLGAGGSSSPSLSSSVSDSMLARRRWAAIAKRGNLFAPWIERRKDVVSEMPGPLNVACDIRPSPHRCRLLLLSQRQSGRASLEDGTVGNRLLHMRDGVCARLLPWSANACVSHFRMRLRSRARSTTSLTVKLNNQYQEGRHFWSHATVSSHCARPLRTIRTAVAPSHSPFGSFRCTQFESGSSYLEHSASAARS